MKRKSLTAKLIGTFVVAFTLLTIIFAIAVSIWFNTKYYENNKEKLTKASSIIKESAIKHINVDKYSDDIGLKNVIRFVASTLGSDILLADNLGYIYMVSDQRFAPYKYSKIGLNDEVMDVLKSGVGVDNLEIPTIAEDRYVYLEPIIENGYFYGTIVMIIPHHVIMEKLKLALSGIWVIATFMIFVNSIVIYVFTKKLIINPVKEINTVANKFAKGEVGKRVEIKSRDEIGELAESFNIMANSLEQVDKNRRDFISNVSHEIRSPITSIKGFIAAILDGVVPKDKEKYYLNIVYDEIRRLARLVNDLLDLSAMESGKFNLNIQEFDINSVLKLCLANSEGNLIDKQMKVEFVCQSEREFVAGDKDRIVQVATNLIDNAIKYGTVGGHVKVKSKTKGDKVLISVYNDGVPLTKDQMIEIWDRFYMVDKSRTQKISSGLGLPIVRLILTQHGEDIWVKSGQENGVTFTFSLPKV